MKKIYQRHKKIILSSIMIISIIYILLYLRPVLIQFDEDYTLNLIHYNFSKLIYFDSMDVHPPLYYLLIKIFISITTFWTSFIPFKVLSARLFSIITSIITFIYLRKFTLKLHIANNSIIQWVLFLLIPGVLGITYSFQQLTDIRMYSLAAMWIVMEFYYLLQFHCTSRTKFLILSTISAILAEYTHYYAAIFSGLLLMIYFIYYFMHRDLHKSLKLFISETVMAISFLPWMPIFLKQIHKPSTYWMSSSFELKEVCEFILIIILFIYPISKAYKKNNKLLHFQIIIINSIILTVFIFSMSYSLFKGPIFQSRYMFPIMVIYEFIGINLLLKHKLFKHSYVYSIIISVLTVITLASTGKQMLQDNTTTDALTTYTQIIHAKSTKIKVQNPNNINNPNYMLYIEYSHNKFILNKHPRGRVIMGENKTYKRTFKEALNSIYIK